MSENKSRFVNICPIFHSKDIEKTVAFYTEKLKFLCAKHFDKKDAFATIYRDETEIVIIKTDQDVIPNRIRYGVGYDAYIDPASVEGVDLIYNECKDAGVKIVMEPFITDYGSYEFVIEDVDGRYIGIGRIKDKDIYFKDSDVL